jgi:hypothetical protein
MHHSPWAAEPPARFLIEEWKSVMDLQLTLEFPCCGCDEMVNVTVQCSGKGLAEGAGRSVAAVNVPCPECGQVNQLFFEPSGAVRWVRPYVCLHPVPEPSVN